MQNPNDQPTTLFEVSLKSDPSHNEQGPEEETFWDKEDWLRDSKLVLEKGKTEVVTGDDPERDYYDVPLVLKVLPVPAIVINSLTFKAKLTTKGAKLYDVMPTKIPGDADKPSQLEWKIGGGPKFEITKVISVGLNVEFSHKQTVYSPQLEGISSQEKGAVWNFRPQAGGWTGVNNELHLLASVPKGQVLKATFTFEGKVSPKNGLDIVRHIIGSGKPIIDNYTLS